MGEKNLARMLAAHADRFKVAGGATGSPGEPGPEPPELSSLAARVKQALAPVRAPAAYRVKLEGDLSAVAQQRLRGEVQLAEPGPRPEWIIGAAVALVSGIALLLRGRGRSEDDLSAAPRQPSG